MKNGWRILVGLLAVAAFSQSLIGAEAGWQKIFDGKSLKGWAGDERLWTVKDGFIRGETTPEKVANGNTFLVLQGGNLADFELKLKFRIQNGNSGVQYRSKEFAKYRITGYQAEVENNQGKVGFLYHEGGRGWLVNVGDMMEIGENNDQKVVGRVGDQKAMIEAGYYTEKDWNEYHIICQGNHVQHFLNGFQTMELVDNDRVTNPDDPADRKGSIREGVVALQIHAGPPMIVDFKDISIKKLDSKYGDAIVLFDGTEKGLDQWVVNGNKDKSKWEAGTAGVSSADGKKLVNKGGSGEMINLAAEHGDSLDFYSKQTFGDCRIELEVMVPSGSNSGIYVMGEYEVQVLDSFGRADKDMGAGDMGAIYGGHKPPLNASKAPGVWQQYVIEWQAPTFNAAGTKKITDAKFLKVELNGKVLHKDLEMPDKTPGGVDGKEKAEGPLMFQGNHGAVAYRNIIVKPLKK